MLEECEGCGTRFAPDLVSCPHCGLERAEGEMPKIIAGHGPSFPEDAVPAEPEPAAEAPAEAPPAEDAPVGAQAPDAAPEPAPAPPRLPPRLPPPGAPGE